MNLNYNLKLISSLGSFVHCIDWRIVLDAKKNNENKWPDYGLRNQDIKDN